MPPAKFNGYPGSIGAKNYVLSPNGHKGPASYVQFGAGGDVLQATDFGIKNFERVDAGLTTNGTYEVLVANHTGGGPQPTVKLYWRVVATGAEVATSVDLSGSTVNISAVGV